MLDLSRLSPEQRQVVLAPDGPLLVIAGPGSGKTTVLAARVAHLIVARGLAPRHVLALAFTAAAARELRTRLARVLGDRGEGVEVATFHAFGLRLVRRWSAELGFPPGPLAVYAEEDARALIREAAEAAGVDHEQWPPRLLQQAVARYRLADAEAAEPAVIHVAEAYEELLRHRRALDFASMLVLPLRLLRNVPPALRLYQQAYGSILVDEFQDVCAAQYALTHLLAERHRRVTAVGDPLQSIFGFRGADVRFLLAFRHDFPEARVLPLSQNFRSSARIVELANALGAPLGHRQPLWTANLPGHFTVLHAADDERSEAAFVAAEIARIQGSDLADGLGGVAVLYRTNRQARELALALRAQRLPYRVRGAGDFFARREVRDALAYLRLAHNPDDAAALVRIVNSPPRRLGRLAERLRSEPRPLSEVRALAEGTGPAAAEAVRSFAALVDDLSTRSRDLAPAALLDLVLDRTGYSAWLARRPDGAERLENLAALRALAERERDLAAWLADMELDPEGETEADAPGRVLLTTIHLAKGGEWPVVFVVGVEEGLLPHSRALAAAADDGSGVEEELRLTYVAMTRPCERLYVSHCRTRRLGTGRAPRRPSRFLRELPAGLFAMAA